MSTEAPKGRAEMTADAAREIGILVIVFGVLDPVLEWHKLHYIDNVEAKAQICVQKASNWTDLPWGVMVLMVVIGVACYGIGQEIEKRRKP